MAPRIDAGWVTAFFLYDIADAIDLALVGRTIGAATSARMAPKAPAPPYIQYAHPPIAIDGEAVGAATVDGWQARFKIFDYGVFSVALTRPLPGTWQELLADGLRWQDNPDLAATAERLCRMLADRVPDALSRPRPRNWLSEDYFVFTATQLSDVSASDALLASHGGEIAQLLRGERDPLSAQEREEVLRQRISYLAADLAVPTWNAAFVFDTEAGARGTLEIIEFANSQLLEFRYYDGLLDAELARIYPSLQRPGWAHSWFGRRFTRAARQVHSLFIEVNELTDRTENALKIAGDVYAARLFTLVSTRLGLPQWKENVREKLRTLDDIYRFTVEQTAMARGEVLELAIVFILVIELVLVLLGIMR
jgi:hypothetical protein